MTLERKKLELLMFAKFISSVSEGANYSDSRRGRPSQINPFQQIKALSFSSSLSFGTRGVLPSPCRAWGTWPGLGRLLADREHVPRLGSEGLLVALSWDLGPTLGI